MRACLLWVVALIVFVAADGYPARALDWTEYQPAGIGFRIEMPYKPELQDKPTASGSFTHHATATVADSAFLVIYTDKRSGGSSSADVLLDGVVKAQSEGKTVLDVKKETIGGKPARRLRLRDSDKLEFEIRSTIIDDRLLQVLFVGPLDDPIGHRFLESLVLMGP
jgi:hypothetical protein